MKKRMTKTSVDAFIKSDRKTGCKKVYNALQLRGASTYSELVFYTGLKVLTVLGRINQLRYEHELVVADGERNGKTVYRLRKECEPADVMPKSKIEQLIDEIEMLCKNKDVQEEFVCNFNRRCPSIKTLKSLYDSSIAKNISAPESCRKQYIVPQHYYVDQLRQL